MKSMNVFARVVVVGCLLVLTQGCSKSDTDAGGTSASGGGGGGSGSIAGTYASVGTQEITMQFKSGGRVHMTAPTGTEDGTYTAEGDKIIVTVSDQQYTFIRTGNCIEDIRVFGKLCIGGKEDQASGGAKAPAAPSGTYAAKHEAGDFRLEFKPGNTFTLHSAPTGGKAESADGTYTMEGSTIYANLPLGEKMVLTYVNDTLETTTFGFPLTFVKK